MSHREMIARGDHPLGVKLGRPDFPALARSMGCHGVFVENPSRLTEELEKAFTADRPILIYLRGPGGGVEAQ